MNTHVHSVAFRCAPAEFNLCCVPEERMQLDILWILHSKLLKITAV